MYISQGGISTERLTRESQKITMMTTGAIPWRKADLRYRRNECFIDVVEGLNLIMSNKGSILKVDVSGAIMVKAFLSGMPECKLGLNDKVLMDAQRKDGASSSSSSRRKGAAGVELDDCQFHQCVRLGRFDVDRTIAFIPPDGEFELMKYRTTEHINLPFRVHAIVNEIGKTRVEFKILVKVPFPAHPADDSNNCFVFAPFRRRSVPRSRPPTSRCTSRRRPTLPPCASASCPARPSSSPETAVSSGASVASRARWSFPSRPRPT